MNFVGLFSLQKVYEEYFLKYYFVRHRTTFLFPKIYLVPALAILFWDKGALLWTRITVTSSKK
jgi:hypothetical protein